MLSHPLLSPAFLLQFSDFTLYITFKAYYPLLFTFSLLPSFLLLKSRIYYRRCTIPFFVTPWRNW